MGEAETEAAPGGKLEWRSENPESLEFAVGDARHYYLVCKTRPWFRIKYSAERTSRHFGKDRVWDHAPHLFDTRVEAKAACEHHHASGRWE